MLADLRLPLDFFISYFLFFIFLGGGGGDEFDRRNLTEGLAVYYELNAH